MIESEYRSLFPADDIQWIAAKKDCIYLPYVQAYPDDGINSARLAETSVQRHYLLTAPRYFFRLFFARLFEHIFKKNCS